MSQISPILRDAEDNGIAFWCPGCNGAHYIKHGTGNGPRWSWNGDINKPTFTPSILIQSGHYCLDRPANTNSCWCTYNTEHPDSPSRFSCGICHSFVTDGKIQFLSDCTHGLAGQTVDLPNWKP